MESNAYDLTTGPGCKMGPFARLKWSRRNREYIKERAQKGWSKYDVWDFDCYLAKVISEGLEFLSKNHMSHPYDVTPEEWSEKLAYISKCFKQYLEEPECPAYEAYHRACVTEREKGCVSVSAPEELLQAWREEEERNYANKMNRLKEGFDLLYEFFPNLWD